MIWTPDYNDTILRNMHFTLKSAFTLAQQQRLRDLK